MVAKTKPTERRHTGATRTTLSLDNDVLLLIRQRAEMTGESMGRAASELIRNGGELNEIDGGSYRSIKLLPKRGERRPVTMEFVNMLRDELP